jgi:uncharacterized phage protein (TIGR01671 family)
MREIKFRAWDNVDYMSSPFTIKDVQDRKIMFTDNCIVMQFTGLKDKNGVEIYEGDIVKYFQPYSKAWHTHIVKWDNLWACFGLFEEGNKWCKESDWVKIKEIEVIGNIYENPELLKEKE